MQCEAAPEGHAAIDAFSENRAGAERLAGFVRQNYSAGHGTNHGFNSGVLEMFSYRAAEFFGIFGVLEHVEFFDVVRRMFSAGQFEMPSHNCAGLNQQIVNFLFSHELHLANFS